ncbi:MAG: hypothetical protein ACTS2F_30145 [Thainema sp.]
MELDEVYLVAATGFVVPALYLAKNARLLEKIPKVKDENNILLPTLLTLSFPFILSIIYFQVKGTSIN